MDRKAEEKKRGLLENIQNCLQENSLEELEHIERVLLAIKGSKKGGLYYFARFLGIEWHNGKAIMTLGMQNANTYGVAQGGTVYTLADMAMGYKVMSQLPPEKSVHTIEMKMNFIKPGKGERLIAQPEILHVGHNTAVLSCQVHDDRDKLVAQGLGTFFIADHSK